MGHSEVTMETLISQEHRGGIWNEISKRLVTTDLCQSQDYYTSGANMSNISEELKNAVLLRKYKKTQWKVKNLTA